MIADPKKAFGKSEEAKTSDCAHSRLILETSPKGYLTGGYICDHCGVKFDAPNPR